MNALRLHLTDDGQLSYVAARAGGATVPAVRVSPDEVASEQLESLWNVVAHASARADTKRSDHTIHLEAFALRGTGPDASGERRVYDVRLEDSMISGLTGTLTTPPR